MTTKTFLAAATAATLALSGTAFAKAHNQGDTNAPGSNVGAETASSAQTLGGALGNGKPAQGNLGKSGDAGKPADDSDE